MREYPFTQDRELSWLKFNERVLEEAADPDVPLLERLKFLAIFGSNLDEFYMVRCGSLYDMSLVDKDHHDKRSGLTPTEQLHAIFHTTHTLYKKKDAVTKEIEHTMRDIHLCRVHKKDLTKKQSKFLYAYFEEHVLPVLSPQIIDLQHPFPHLLNKQQYIFVRMKENDQVIYGIVPVPTVIDRIIYFEDGSGNYALLEQLIYYMVKSIFPKNEILYKTIIRVTRNADINLNMKEIDVDEDYRHYMKKILKKRDRLSPIRLELYKEADEDSIQFLCKNLHLETEQAFLSKSTLDMDYLFALTDHAEKVHLGYLSYPPFKAQESIYVDRDRKIIPQILNHDVLLLYPYQNIDIFLDLLKEAANDPDVISIKMTIYRLAKNSRIIHYLIEALENGKEVSVLMELRARFDEKRNIEAAEVIENAGGRVQYGFEEYKVHSKVCMISRKSKHGIQHITQIGTGNYNEKTSHQYTDYSFITARPDIGEDAMHFFNNMALGNTKGSYNRLLVSPVSLKSHVLEMMDKEITKAENNEPAQILLKMNSITDVDLIKKISDASQAGVPVKMVVRGICCIVPGLPNYTEKVEVHSIVGRYLEHARIYAFGVGNEQKVYISSADFMTRNTEKRVEVACPIDEPKLKQDILDYFKDQFKDDVKGRVLQKDGTYTKLDTETLFDSQNYAMKKAEELALNKKVKEEKKSGIFKFIDRILGR